MRKRKQPNQTKIISITSGKGGVGKTNIVCNLAYCFASMGKKVMIMDADLSLGNVSVVLGLAPKYNISNVLYGDKQLKDIIISDKNGILVLPASSGIPELSNLTETQKMTLMSRFGDFLSDIDILLIDTGAGISSNVIYFNLAAGEIMVIVTPEPTSITDAYALIKVMSTKHGQKNFSIILNMAKNEKEAKGIYKHLGIVADKFLKVSLSYGGFILYDENVSKSVIMQKTAMELYPESKSAACFKKLAYDIISQDENEYSSGNLQFFFNNLFRKN
ncbi:MAG: flagellar synthesis regulator FleN [Candidatus Acididesulfobacter guangdongensis]|uniref:Flagellar synthesis regulator FleN n=1 Tax=Acididesulfobacter guangdongensis TaxID=2597225 RepID=A0A519BG07_ACIG2|nr:MAG: flagellar synthesis regulator FleN [Candidatus Acididesulfobacter guangdongensis]